MQGNIYGGYELLLGQVYTLRLTSASQPGIDVFAPEPQHKRRATQARSSDVCLSQSVSYPSLFFQLVGNDEKNRMLKVEST
jgi:hypothetical protein